MVFGSPIFLFLFLPVTLSVALLLPGVRLKNVWLLAVSLVFYGWAEPAFVLLILASTMVNYTLGLRIGGAGRLSRRRAWTALAVAVNVGLLVFFKYGNFLVENLNWLLAAMKLGAIRMKPIALPIGISFFTFHALSYIVDIHRGKGVAARRPSDMALYIFFFPQLIAGPIMRWSTMAPQIAGRVLSADRFWEGVRRFIYGLAKKTLVANSVAAAADQVFLLPPGALSPTLAWLGVICYAIQIYFDFSGYSDMALGLGKMFGFEFMENFNYPYTAQSMRDFWRRWHISLTSWFRDYVYIPLGGNRGSSVRTSANLLPVFLLCGFWHGASWTFVVWGLYQGLFLALERTRFGVWLAALPRPLRHAYTLLIVLAGWVIFRAETLPQAAVYLETMVGLAGATGGASFLDVVLSIGGMFGLVDDRTLEGIQVTQRIVSMVLTNQVVWAVAAGALFSTPFASWFRRELARTMPQRWRSPLQLAGLLAQPLLLMASLVVAAIWLGQGTSLHPNVIIGRQGWLYHTWQEDWTTKGYHPGVVFSPAALEDWRRLFETRRDWLARRGIEYLVVIPPDKQVIYPEYLPAWAVRPGAGTNLDAFVACMKRSPGLELLDLRRPLLEAKSTGRPFPLTDLHWNQYGAFVASQEVVRTLARHLPGLSPLALDCFEVRTGVEPGGNLAKFLTSAETLVEKDAPTLIPRPPLRPLPAVTSEMRACLAFRVQNPEQKGRLLIFGDSFAQALLPFLGHHFSEVSHFEIYFQHAMERGQTVKPAHTWVPALIEEKRPAVVIDEIVGSLLHVEDPADILRRDGLGRD